MAANYKLVRNPNPRKDGKIQPLHARYVSRETLKTEDIIDLVKEKSSFSSADIKGVLRLIQEALVYSLKNGTNIELEGIGTFSASLQCKPVMDQKEIRAESVHFKDVAFRSSIRLRNQLKAMRLSRLEEEKKKEYTAEECEKRMLWYLEKHEYITRPVYMSLNNCGRTKAITDLNQFQEKGLIKRNGYGPTTFYVRIQPSVEKPLKGKE